jgi:uncharacterized membrane protein HdeD (DUF308 family)
MVVLVNNWWAFVIRGIAAIIFGILALILPGMALVTLILLWGIYALADGVFNLIGAFRRDAATQQSWWALLIEGIISIGAGIAAFVYPGLTALVLLYIIAAWALVTGVMELVAAARLRKQISGEWILVLTGIVSVLFGILLFVFPGAGALAVVLWIGVYAVVFGALLVSLGLRLRKWAHAEHPTGGGFGTALPGH